MLASKIRIQYFVCSRNKDSVFCGLAVGIGTYWGFALLIGIHAGNTIIFLVFRRMVDIVGAILYHGVQRAPLGTMGCTLKTIKTHSSTIAWDGAAGEQTPARFFAASQSKMMVVSRFGFPWRDASSQMPVTPLHVSSTS